MSTHKSIDRICCAVIAMTLLLTFLFMNGEKLGIKAASTTMGYESRLFDASTVHSIDIIMDDWDSFLETCTNEEYQNCTVVIDSESYPNVAIRAKGNTSLTQVASYDNDRYSFKIEFDHNDSTNTYYGLDKLCLNNIIQDNTYMKDFLVYQMMGAYGVDAPLCSYVYITVNGEDWGLYLAVEGVEDSFLQRNYGTSYGEVYKPDSQSMGGGRGNGREFDMDDVKEFLGGDASNEEASTETENVADGSNNAADGQQNAPTGDMPQGGMPTDGMPQGNMPDGQNDAADGQQSTTDGQTAASGMPTEMPEESTEGEQTGGQPQGMPQDGKGGMGGKGGMDDKGGMSMGSDDVKLIYTDDSYDSYSNIFDNAKTDITDSDKDRLIASLKSLNANEDIDEVVNVDEVLRYFVVHNFVLNFDSYTGSMIHNYYLYEEDGQLSMIPWDYNLAFGGFQSNSDATGLVNSGIDSPVSGGTVDSRPMLAWIFADEEYTQLYHQYFDEFISKYFESGYFEAMMQSVKEMIAPYVEKDPTKFCTYEEFESGIDTLEEFCLLRAQSVRAQLDGTIATTSDEQSSETLIDAGDLSISAMGSMNNDMGGGGDSKMGGGGGPQMGGGGDPQMGGNKPQMDGGQQFNSDTLNSGTP